MPIVDDISKDTVLSVRNFQTSNQNMVWFGHYNPVHLMTMGSFTFCMVLNETGMSGKRNIAELLRTAADNTSSE